MLRIVAYDIGDPRRLKRVAKCCGRYGVRIEKSVFESRLGNERFSEFWRELCGLAEPDEDSLVAIPVCAACEAGIQTAGRVVRPEPKSVYVF